MKYLRFKLNRLYRINSVSCGEGVLKRVCPVRDLWFMLMTLLQVVIMQKITVDQACTQRDLLCCLSVEMLFLCKGLLLCL